MKFCKIYFIAFSALAACLSSCTKFDELQQQIDDQNARLASLPTGIVMMSSTLSDCHKGDTCEIMIRVNPSDYAVKKEKLSFLAAHNIYTCYTLGEESGEGFEPVYDPTVSSDFSVVDVLKDTVIADKGIWRVKLAINGNGNYYDDAHLFVRADSKDASGTERSVCSATSCQVFVIPTLSEGIKLNTTCQNLYPFDKKSGMVKTEAKPYVIGLWSNGYVSKIGQQRLYDRTKVSVEAVSDSLFCQLNSDLFDSYGIVTVTPDFSAEYWKEQIKQEGKQASITVPDAFLTLKYAGAREETAQLPFKFKLFYGTALINNRDLSIGKGETQKTYSFNYTAERTASGYDELDKVRFMTDDGFKASMHMEVTFKDTKDSLVVKETDFSRCKIGTPSYWLLSRFHNIRSGQSPAGERVSIPDSLSATIQYYYFRHVVNVVE